jgi:hypothetical protein
LFGNIETQTTGPEASDTLYGGDGDDRFALQDSDPDAFFGDAGYDSIFVYRNTDLTPMHGIEEIVIARNPVFLTVTNDSLDGLQKITGDLGGFVTMMDGWSLSATGADYDTYTHSSGSTLLIDRDLTVTIS